MIVCRSALVLIAALAVCTAGCSKGPAGPKTAPARGKVTYKKVPVEGATVSFLGDGRIAPAIAITNAAGEFILTTTRSGDGAVPGKHRVTVTKIVGAPVAASKGPVSMQDAAKAAKDALPAKPLSLLPTRYSMADSSNLNFEVKDGKKNDFPIELTD